MEELFFKPITNIKEVEEIQSRYSYDDCMLEDIIMDEGWDIKIKDDNFKGTDDFYINLFKLLNIPYPFTRKIPGDLVVTNVDRLNDEFNTPVTVVRRENTLVNVVKATNNKGKQAFFQKINTGLLLDYFSSENFEMKNCYVGDEGAVIDIIHKDLGQLKLKDREVGDIIDIGYRLTNPFTMFDNSLKMSLYLNQLVCSNGMVVGRDFGGAKLSLNKNLGDEQVFIERFRTNIDHSITKRFTLDELTDLYNRMVQTPIKYRWLKPIISTVKKFGDDFLARVMKIDWEQEGESYKDNFENEENEDSDFNYFQTIFDLTQQAQNESVVNRLFLEGYNDKIINLFQKQLKITSQYGQKD